jgi:beta-barrel assembly-enhancing protease
VTARRLAALAATLALVAARPAEDPFKAPIAAGYQPSDKDERGLWMQVDELERTLKTSAFTIRDPALNAYVRQVFCRTVGEAECAGVRIYIVRTAAFNASMAPTGMMLVNSGLLLRVRDEAQLAAVLGHEYTHFTHRHSLQSFRDAKGKLTALAWLSMIPVASYGAAAAMSALQLGMISSVFGFNRGMESEADAGSVPLLVRAGYDPASAWKLWEQQRAEMDATAAARKKRSRKDDGGLFSTHPPTQERMAALKAMAAKAQAPGLATGRETYRAALTPWWPQFVDDQIKLNDFGATEYLIGSLAAEGGWTADLLYARGELYRTRGQPADLAPAAGFYREAIALPAAPAEAWRGLGLVELRAGHDDAGQAALAAYLQKKPDAPDWAMIAMMGGLS